LFFPEPVLDLKGRQETTNHCSSDQAIAQGSFGAKNFSLFVFLPEVQKSGKSVEGTV
jgi:hypothetical protein